MKSQDVYHWSQLLFPHHFPIKLDMILGEGIILEVECRLIGNSLRSKDKSEKRRVLFDSSFVWHRLNDVLEPLDLTSKEQLTKIIEKCWDTYPDKLIKYQHLEDSEILGLRSLSNLDKQALILDRIRSRE